MLFIFVRSILIWRSDDWVCRLQLVILVPAMLASWPSPGCFYKSLGVLSCFLNISLAAACQSIGERANDVGRCGTGRCAAYSISRWQRDAADRGSSFRAGQGHVVPPHGAISCKLSRLHSVILSLEQSLPH